MKLAASVVRALLTGLAFLGVLSKLLLICLVVSCLVFKRTPSELACWIVGIALIIAVLWQTRMALIYGGVIPSATVAPAPYLVWTATRDVVLCVAWALIVLLVGWPQMVFWLLVAYATRTAIELGLWAFVLEPDAVWLTNSGKAYVRRHEVMRGVGNLAWSVGLAVATAHYLGT